MLQEEEAGTKELQQALARAQQAASESPAALEADAVPAFHRAAAVVPPAPPAAPSVPGVPTAAVRPDGSVHWRLPHQSQGSLKVPKSVARHLRLEADDEAWMVLQSVELPPHPFRATSSDSCGYLASRIWPTICRKWGVLPDQYISLGVISREPHLRLRLCKVSDEELCAPVVDLRQKGQLEAGAASQVRTPVALDRCDCSITRLT